MRGRDPAGNFQPGSGPTPGASHAVSHRHQPGRRDGGGLRHLWRRSQHRGAAAGACRARWRRGLQYRLRSGAQQTIRWLRLSRPATDEERCSRDKLSRDDGRPSRRTTWRAGRRDPPSPGGSRCSVGRRRSTDWRRIRAIPVEALRLGLVDEPASPDCLGPHDFGLSDPDQCLHRSAQDLVPLAGRSIALRRHPADSAPAQTCAGQKEERPPSRE